MATEASGLRPLALEVLAVPNDNIMSDQPTNATIVGTDEVYIVDPGDHAGVALVRAALAARGNPPVRAILLTHAHPDHANAAGTLREEFGCPLLLHRREEPLADRFLAGVPIDWSLVGGMRLPIDGGWLETFDTPGHSPGHVSFYAPDSRTLIAGDLVSGFGTVGIFPPLGEMRAYCDSLARMQRVGIEQIIPGHGPTQTPEIFARYLARRAEREAEIYAAVSHGPTTIEAIVTALYPDVQPRFRRAAAATTLAHLEKLRTEGRVTQEGDEPFSALWRAVGERR